VSLNLRHASAGGGALDAIAAELVAAGNERGGHDSITVALVRVGESARQPT